MRGSRNFFGGGGGGHDGQRIFFNFYFVLNFILQFIEGVQYFSKDPEGSYIFQAGGGVQLFSGKGGS